MAASRSSSSRSRCAASPLASAVDALGAVARCPWPAAAHLVRLAVLARCAGPPVMRRSAGGSRLDALGQLVLGVERPCSSSLRALRARVPRPRARTGRTASSAPACSCSWR